MYDIEKDIENMAIELARLDDKVLYVYSGAMRISEEPVEKFYKERARAALNASTAVKELKEALERIKELEEMNRWNPDYKCFQTPPKQKD